MLKDSWNQSVWACQYEAENNMLDSKVLETNVIASEESVESGAKYWLDQTC